MLRVLLALLCLALPAAAGAAPSPDSLPPSLARVFKQAGLRPGSIGVWVAEAGGRRVLAYGADRALNPASTMKLVTTFAGLELLGPAYVWKTEAYASGPLRDGVLQGDLVIKGYGDPKLTVESLWLLLRAVRVRGVREIAGDILLDRSWFDLPPYDPAAFDGEWHRPYNAGPDALLVNFSALRATLLPDQAAGRVAVALEPAPDTLELRNELSLAAGPCNGWSPKKALRVETEAARPALRFAGAMPESCGEQSVQVSPMPAPQFAAGLVGSVWREVGGSVAGQVREGRLPPGATLLVSWDSPTLSEVVRDINKFSNNVMARQLFLTLGAESLQPPATLEKARTAIASWLRHRGLDFSELVVDNGAGLSRSARISARHLGELLEAAWRSPLYPELAASLPLAAVDGTLRKRLNGNGVAGQAHLKTGTLDGVRSIAGYLLDRRGRNMIVVLIANDAEQADSRLAQEALMNWVYERD